MTLVLGTGLYVWIQASPQPAEVGVLTGIGQTGKLRPREEWRLAGGDIRVKVSVRNLLEFLSQSVFPATFLCWQPAHHGEAPGDHPPSIP